MCMYVVCHIQEIPENGADTAHLDFIHGGFLWNSFGLAKHSWTATWNPLPAPDSHVAFLKLTQNVTVCGYPIPYTSLDSNIYQIGPGLVQLIFPTAFGKVAIIE